MKQLLPIILLATQILSAAQPMGELPPGVPRVVNPDGSLVSVESMFTTPGFQNEALRLIIEEANRAAKELNLPEPLPITRTNLTHRFISSFGFMLHSQAVGNITTSNYTYFISRGYKFSQVTIANYDEHCFEYQDKYQWPVSRIDTNAAYQLATQYLAAARMDVEGLNRDCVVRVEPSAFWNRVAPGEAIKTATFVPIYYVWWTPKKPPPLGSGGGADVELLLPTKTLIAFGVDDPKYILRKPIIFTNLAALFPGKATITTNWPVEPQYLTLPAR